MNEGSINARPVLTRSMKYSGMLGAGCIADAMGGDYAKSIKGMCGETPRIPLAQYVKHPMLTTKLTAKQKEKLLMETLYLIRILERKLAASEGGEGGVYHV